MKRLAATLLAILLTACAGTPFEWDNARQIKTGMTEQEVTALLGQPYMVKSQGQTLTWVWSYADTFSGARSVAIVFKDGKVTEPPPIPASFK